MSHQQPTASTEHQLKLWRYVSGFSLSIGLTLAAYYLVVHQVASGWALLGAISALALIQFVVQVIFFLHLGDETGPRWKLGVFAFMLGVVGILVIGSLWIMANLDYHHAHHDHDGDINTYIIKDEGIKP